MSQPSKKDMILSLRDQYARENHRQTKSSILDTVCKAAGFDRKYAIKLLRGLRTYKERPARGPKWGPKEEKLLVQAWNAAGNPCGKYLKAVIDAILDGLSVLQHVNPAVADRVRAMSASTMDRILRGKPRQNRLWNRKNRRSGHNAIWDKIPCVSGERVPAREVGPGDIQVDSVSFCGGRAEGDYFWVATATDRRTQWFEARPSFNLCVAHYKPAFSANLEAFPFEIVFLHSDNGPEVVNAIIYEYVTGRWPKATLGRSWPGRKNHNAHIEQKNGSVLRVYLGDVRLDDPALQRQFELTLQALCLYNNFFRPCVMLLEKTKRPDGKGYICRYDSPKTPYERVLESGVLTQKQEEALRRKRASLNPVWLMELFLKRRAKLFRMQAASEKRRKSAVLPAADSALRAAPSGTSAGREDGGAATATPAPDCPPHPVPPPGVPHLTQTNPPGNSFGVLFT